MQQERGLTREKSLSDQSKLRLLIKKYKFDILFFVLLMLLLIIMIAKLTMQTTEFVKFINEAESAGDKIVNFENQSTQVVSKIIRKSMNKWKNDIIQLLLNEYIYQQRWYPRERNEMLAIMMTMTMTMTEDYIQENNFTEYNDE